METAAGLKPVSVNYRCKDSRCKLIHADEDGPKRDVVHCFDSRVTLVNYRGKHQPHDFVEAKTKIKCTPEVVAKLQTKFASGASARLAHAEIVKEASEDEVVPTYEQVRYLKVKDSEESGDGLHHDDVINIAFGNSEFIREVTLKKRGESGAFVVLMSDAQMQLLIDYGKHLFFIDGLFNLDEYSNQVLCLHVQINDKAFTVAYLISRK